MLQTEWKYAEENVTLGYVAHSINKLISKENM